jgi:hypothetical protein
MKSRKPLLVREALVLWRTLSSARLSVEEYDREEYARCTFFDLGRGDLYRRLWDLTSAARRLSNIGN